MTKSDTDYLELAKDGGTLIAGLLKTAMDEGPALEDVLAMIELAKLSAAIDLAQSKRAILEEMRHPTAKGACPGVVYSVGEKYPCVDEQGHRGHHKQILV